MSGPQAIGYLELAVATALVVLSGGVSLALKLGLERRLLWAACRTVTQLLLIGYVLEFIFGLNHPLAVASICLVMVAVAAHAAIGRSDKTFAGLYGLSFLALVAILPTLVSGSMGVDFQVAAFYGGTGLLIAVSVAFDLVQKIDSHLVMRNYRGLLEKS